MKRNFILVSVLSLSVFLVLTVFTLFQIKDFNRTLTAHSNLLVFKEQATEIIRKIDEHIADLIVGANYRQDDVHKTFLFAEPNSINTLVNALHNNLESYGCIDCHKSDDIPISKITANIQKIKEKSGSLRGSVTAYLSGNITPQQLLSAKRDFTDSMAGLKLNFQAMEDSYHNLVLKKTSIYPRVQIGLFLFTLVSLLLLIFLFYKKVFKDIYKLTMVSEHLVMEGVLPPIDLSSFKNPETTILADTLITTFEKLKDTQAQLEHQLEEIKSMNEELQSSNQQMEMITCDLEETKQNLEVKVKDKTRELEKAYAELQELDGLKSSFLQSISHEFKTPLTPLFGYLKLFKNKELGELTPLQEQSMDIMLTCAEKLYNTIDDLILLARLDVEKERYMLKDVDLTYLLKNTVTRVEKELGEKNLKLSLDLPDISILIKGEQLMLIQSLLHMLRNAIKYSHEKGEIAVILNQEDDKAVLRVIDTGAGISAAPLNEINDYLSSRSVYTTRKGDIITIGINLLKRVVAIHDAGVRYKSEKGHGTEVELTFPLKV